MTRTHREDRMKEKATQIGRYIITGPDFTDGSGFTLCLAGPDGRCSRCVASFDREADATMFAYEEGVRRAQEDMIRAALEPLGCPERIFDHHAVEWAAEEIQVLRQQLAAAGKADQQGDRA